MKNRPLPLRILIVDDDALSREVLSLLLEHAGYVVSAADSGEAAVCQLSATPRSLLPHVVLTDIQMPGIAGSALAHALRGCCDASSLLLAMSGSHPPDDMIREFDGLLLKPFTVEELAATIATIDNPVEATNKAVTRDIVLLDLSIYEKLAASMRPDRLQQLYEVCLTDSTARISRMRQFASNNDDVSFRREAHAIKGGASLVGAIELQTLAGSLEDSGLQANHVASLNELILSCDRLRRILMAQNKM